MKRSIEMDHTNVNEETGLIDRFKKYVLDSSDYFAASAVMMTGNSYGAAQIMKTDNRFEIKISEGMKGLHGSWLHSFFDTKVCKRSCQWQVLCI